ncbi:MAG: hypothetical protein H8D67_29455 [Deltaproteobacteria bacterium]|nr:hypothetical protein [Deltaproteobacteria bacterium]
MKALKRKALKQRIMNLAQEQFGVLLKDVRFSGPFEDEDIDVDIILRKRIALNEIGGKLWNIYHPLRKDGYDVLIGHEFESKVMSKK